MELHITKEQILDLLTSSMKMIKKSSSLMQKDKKLAKALHKEYNALNLQIHMIRWSQKPSIREEVN